MSYWVLIFYFIYFFRVFSACRLTVFLAMVLCILDLIFCYSGCYVFNCVLVCCWAVVLFVSVGFGVEDFWHTVEVLAAWWSWVLVVPWEVGSFGSRCGSAFVSGWACVTLAVGGGGLA